MEKPLLPSNPESIRDFVNHFQKSRILLTAFELDIFSIVEKKPRTSEAVAKKIKADTRATDRLMNAACAIGFLEKRDDIFNNTEVASKYFVKGKPDYMSGLMHTVSLWQTWSTLTDAVINGAAVYDKRSADISEREPKWLESFIEAMHYRATKQAAEIVSKIDLKDVHQVLDVGGGSGAFAMAFAKAGEITATVFDLPSVTPLTMEYIKKDKMTEKVRTASGDYNSEMLPKGFDLVFLSAVVHINSYNGNVKLIKKCAASLNPGGQIVIQDQVMNDDRTKPAGGAMFALNMLVGTKEGDTYTEKEICEWFEKAGLTFEKRVDVFMGNSLMIGRKK